MLTIITIFGKNKDILGEIPENVNKNNGNSFKTRYLPVKYETRKNQFYFIFYAGGAF